MHWTDRLAEYNRYHRIQEAQDEEDLPPLSDEDLEAVSLFETAPYYEEDESAN